MFTPRPCRCNFPFATLIFALLLTAVAGSAQPPQPAAKAGTWDEKTTGMRFIRVKPGTFLMGEGKDAKKTEIKTGFYLATTVVTQKQWQAVLPYLPGP